MGKIWGWIKHILGIVLIIESTHYKYQFSDNFIMLTNFDGNFDNLI